MIMPLKVKTMYNFPKIELFLDFKDHFALRDVLHRYIPKKKTEIGLNFQSAFVSNAIYWTIYHSFNFNVQGWDGVQKNDPMA